MKLYKTNGRQRVEERIRKHIINDSLRPGDQLLPERELSKICRTSRTMLRSILDKLEKEKIIERRQGMGTFVTGVNNAQPEEISEPKKLKFSSARYFSYSAGVKTKLKFYSMDYHPLQKEFWFKMIREFSAMEPRIEVVPVFGDDESPDSLDESISKYDVAQMIPCQLSMIPESKIMNLEPFIAKDKLDLSNFLDIALKPCASNGFIRGLPFSLSFSGILVINKDLVSKANNIIPDRFSSLEHFFKWCSELTSSLDEGASHDKVWGTNLQNYSYYVLSEMSKGFFIKGGIDTSALKKHVGLMLQYRDKAYSRAFPVEELYEQFLKGYIAVFPGTTLDLMFLKDEAKFPWTIRAMPREKSESYYAVPLINCISSNTQFKEESWEFIKYLSSAKAQRMLAECQDNMPVLDGILRSDAFSAGDKFHRQTLLDVLKHGEGIKDIKPSDIVRVPRMNVNDLWRKLFKENRTNDEILSGIVDLADEINQNNNIKRQE